MFCISFFPIILTFIMSSIWYLAVTEGSEAVPGRGKRASLIGLYDWQYQMLAVKQLVFKRHFVRR
jgi:hypothetical protein